MKRKEKDGQKLKPTEDKCENSKKQNDINARIYKGNEKKWVNEWKKKKRKSKVEYGNMTLKK